MKERERKRKREREKKERKRKERRDSGKEIKGQELEDEGFLQNKNEDKRCQENGHYCLRVYTGYP